LLIILVLGTSSSCDYGVSKLATIAVTVLLLATTVKLDGQGTGQGAPCQNTTQRTRKMKGGTVWRAGSGSFSPKPLKMCARA